MAVLGAKFFSLRPAAILFFIFMLASVFISAERSINHEASRLSEAEELEPNYLVKIISFLWQSDESGYQHVWPELSFGWQATIGTIIGFLGAAFGSVGGVGGGGIFVPMLTLIIGFDPKSATAISKCMIMGAAVSTVYHNLRLRHPTLDLPVIDYDLVLLIQPMLMLGISIGVTFNVIFPDWAITVILIILCIGTSVKAFFKGLDTWQMETILIQDATNLFESTGGSEEVEYKPLPDGQGNDPPKANKKVTILQNIYWKELGLLVFVWVAYLAVQIAKNYTAPCSTTFWVLNLLQIPVSIGVFLYEAIGLYEGRRRISSKGDEIMDWQVHRLLMFCACGVVAWNRWRICHGSIVFGNGNSSSGIKWHSHLRDAVLLINVCRRVLSLGSFSCALCSLLHCCGHCCCLYWSIYYHKIDHYFRKGIPHHLCASLHNIYQRHSTRWGWHNKHDWKD